MRRGCLMWMATKEGFASLIEIRKTTQQDMIHFLETNEKLTRRPFATGTTKKMYENYMRQRKLQV